MVMMTKPADDVASTALDVPDLWYSLDGAFDAAGGEVELEEMERRGSYNQEPLDYLFWIGSY